MKRRNHVLLLACACAFIGAEQLIMGALKGTKARKEAATPARRPTLNERLTALEARVDALENQKATAQDTLASTTELIETTTPVTSTEASALAGVDQITTETPVSEEVAVSEVETTTPIIPLEDLASNLNVSLSAPTGSQESLILDKILAEQTAAAQ